MHSLLPHRYRLPFQIASAARLSLLPPSHGFLRETLGLLWCKGCHETGHTSARATSTFETVCEKYRLVPGLVQQLLKFSRHYLPGITRRYHLECCQHHPLSSSLVIQQRYASLGELDWRICNLYVLALPDIQPLRAHC